MDQQLKRLNLLLKPLRNLGADTEAWFAKVIKLQFLCGILVLILCCMLTATSLKVYEPDQASGVIKTAFN